MAGTFSPSQVWAQQQQGPPPDALPWAQPSGVDLHAGLVPIFAPPPQVTLDQNPQHQVEGAFANGNTQEGIRLHDQAKLAKDYEKDANPWGSPNNHPGIGGKIAHGLSVFANAAEPLVMSRIPGTTDYSKGEEESLAKNLNTEVGDESANAYRNAETGKTQEETAEMPGKAKSEEDLQGAQTAHLGEETKAMQEGKPVETSAGLLQVKPDGTAQKITVDGQPVGPPIKTEVKQFNVNGKPHQVLIDSRTGDHLRDMGESGERPAQAPGITMIVPNAQGGGTVERIGVGGTVAPGAQTPQGVNAVNTPTMTQRTAAGRAGTVVAMAPEVMARIDSLSPQLGPIMGRWGEFMQGRVGMDNPEFAGLRSDLLMMSSAVALAHAQGRLPENLREEFDRAINSPQQTPANLKATIQAMLPWLQSMQNQVHPGNTPQGGGNAPPRPATVPPGYEFQENGPQGRGWYKPKAKAQ